MADAAKPLFIFGDVHGCATELLTLIKKAVSCMQTTSEQELIRHRITLAGQTVTLDVPAGAMWLSLGDAFSKGPDPWGVFQILRALKARMVRGNHEHRFLRRQYRQGKGIHDGNRRARALAEQLGSERAVQLCRWIEKAPYIVTGEAREWMRNKRRWIAVHAGPHMQTAGIPSDFQDTRLHEIRSALQAIWCNQQVTPKQKHLFDTVSAITELRYLDPHDRLHWSRVHKSETLVIYGHNPCSDPKFAEIKFAKRGVVHSIGIDTGCVYGGRLSGFWLQDGPRRLLSVKATRQYCAIPKKARMRQG